MQSTPRDPSRPRGLDADELAAVAAVLNERYRGATAEGVLLLHGFDDLVVFVRHPDAGRLGLHIALGSARARIATTTRRWPKHIHLDGPRAERIARCFEHAVFEGMHVVAGERHATLTWSRGDAAAGLRLEVELFGTRGLWSLCDAASGEILELSRTPESEHRKIERGARYTPPPANPKSQGSAPPAVASRFGGTDDLLTTIDEHFTALDLAAETESRATSIRRALERRLQKAEHRLAGLTRQRDAMASADDLRAQADLLLAYSHLAVRGATEVIVPDPADPKASLRIELAPHEPVHLQAEKRYKQARKYAEGRAHCDAQIATAAAERDACAELSLRFDRLEAADKVAGAAADAEFERLLADCRALGITLPIEVESATRKPRGGQQKPPDKAAKLVAREGLRRYESAEGFTILVGKNNTQNDRLSIRIARGNDLWFHVGRGYAGSHVVVQIPKHKTASLETLLDAATLAVHFSKVRGAELCEVIYTHAKHVSKPKGLPPGRVVATGTRELRIKLEPERLRRLLSGDPTP